MIPAPLWAGQSVCDKDGFARTGEVGRVRVRGETWCGCGTHLCGGPVALFPLMRGRVVVQQLFIVHSLSKLSVHCLVAVVQQLFVHCPSVDPAANRPRTRRSGGPGPGDGRRQGQRHLRRCRRGTHRIHMAARQYLIARMTFRGGRVSHHDDLGGLPRIPLLDRSCGPLECSEHLRTVDDGELFEPADVQARYHDQSVELGTADHDDVLVDVLGNVGVNTARAFAGDPKRDGARAAFSCRGAALASKP